MAKCKRYRAEHAYVTIPSLGRLFGGSVSVKDVAVGALAGLVGQGALKWALSKANVTLPAGLSRVYPTLAGLAAGGALYAFEKKKNANRAKAHLIGATLAGAALNVWEEMKAQFPAYFSSYVVLPSRYGYLVSDPRKSGMGYLVDDNRTSQSNLSALRAMGRARAAAGH